MSRQIEDYALVSDCRTGALISRDGSVDWLCLPRYDSASTFGALLGDPDHGRWLVAPTDPDAAASRRYLDRTFVLVTTWRTATGELEVTDFMPHGGGRSDLVRRLRCLHGEVEVHEDLRVRFGYASALPWVRQLTEDAKPVLIAVAGPDAVVRRGPRLTAEGHAHTGDYRLRARGHRARHGRGRCPLPRSGRATFADRGRALPHEPGDGGHRRLSARACRVSPHALGVTRPALGRLSRGWPAPDPARSY